MKKNDILKELEGLKEKGLYPYSYWLGAGASLVLMGVIDDTKDIDIGCSIETFPNLAIKYGVQIAPLGGRMVNIKDNIDVFEENYKPSTVVIDGFQCEILLSLKRFYRLRGRSKDLSRIQKINEFLRNNDLIRGNEHFVNG